MQMCAKLDPLVLPRARRRFWPTCAMQSHLDGIGVKVFGISNVNGERLRHIAIQSNRHRLFAQGKRERTGCFAGLRRLIWFHVDCDVSARRCGLKTKRLWFWFDRHPTRHPGRRGSIRASREHKNDDAIGRDGGNLRKGIEQYSVLQRDLHNTTDVTDAPDFQKKFRLFYRVRRDAAWRRVFFKFMQQHRKTPPSFQKTLRDLADQVHRCEASFASKLAATLDPELPVLDSLVLRVMRTHLGSGGSGQGKWTLLRTGTLESRLERAVVVYNRLTATVGDIRSATGFAELIEMFDKSYKRYLLTDTKKLDFVLWRYGAMLLPR